MLLGKYEVRGTVATGPMGTVYDGWDTAIERRVAIKAIPATPPKDADGRHNLIRFKREAQAAGRLQHPAVVGIFDYGETADHAFIVMEFVDGGSLKSALEGGKRLPLSEIGAVMQDILAGLQYCHAQGVTHRDIKPANVMLTRDGRAKVADFGIARIEQSDITQVGTVMGTPAYMSPEQFRGEAVTARTDIYSAGVILYHMLTGERPFEGGVATIMHKVLSVVPPKPSSFSVQVPHALDAVVARAMAKQPADRFESASAFAQALRQAMVARPARFERTTAIVRLAGTKAASMPPVNYRVAAAACAAIVLAAGGFLVYGRGKPSPDESHVSRLEKPTDPPAARPPTEDATRPVIKAAGKLTPETSAASAAPIERAVLTYPAALEKAAPVLSPASQPAVTSAPPSDPLPLTVVTPEPTKLPPARTFVTLPPVASPAVEAPKRTTSSPIGNPAVVGTLPAPASASIAPSPVLPVAPFRPQANTSGAAELPAGRREERVPAPRPAARTAPASTEVNKSPLPPIGSNPPTAGNRKPPSTSEPLLEAEIRSERSPPPQFLVPNESQPAEKKLFGTFIIIDGRRVLVPSDGSGLSR
jgi:hypothetical protein